MTETRALAREPGVTVAEVVEDLGYEMIFDCAGLIESFAISLREAAARRDGGEVDLNLRRLLRVISAAIQTDSEMRGGER